MAGTRDKDTAALSRLASQLSRCFRTSVVPAEVADPLRASFPAALLLRCALPCVDFCAYMWMIPALRKVHRPTNTFDE